jgi:hypothetical protein
MRDSKVKVQRQKSEDVFGLGSLEVTQFLLI